MPHAMTRMTLPRLLLVLAGIALAVPGAAAVPPPITLTEGVEYALLPAPEPVADADRIEVLEVFSYGCVHCFHLEPALQAWKARLPADVELRYLPATFRPEFVRYARGYYAAQALGQHEATHARVFDALWNRHVAVNSLADLANLYAGLGVERSRFIEAAQSADNRAAVDAAHEKIQRLQLDGTPAFIVAGRYRVLDNLISGSEELLQRVDAVIAMVRAERRRGK